jgi:hypothetical protein
MVFRFLFIFACTFRSHWVGILNERRHQQLLIIYVIVNLIYLYLVVFLVALNLNLVGNMIWWRVEKLAITVFTTTTRISLATFFIAWIWQYWCLLIVWITSRVMIFARGWILHRNLSTFHCSSWGITIINIRRFTLDDQATIKSSRIFWTTGAEGPLVLKSVSVLLG